MNMNVNYQNEILKIIPYDINTILNQIYQYKCFELNITRASIFGNNNNIQKICLINNYWFNHWKKASCCEIIKNELEINYQNNNMNMLSNILCNVFQKINSSEHFESLNPNIENYDITCQNENNPQQFFIDWESEFDLISPELWNLFAPVGNMNQNSKIELNLEYLCNDALMINLSDEAIYVIFWNHDRQKLGKYILKFFGMKNIFIECMKNGGSFRDFYKTYLTDDKDKEINFNETVRMKCINKTEVNLPYKNPYKYPMGLRNIRMTCYMNSALQSLFNVKKLTNYLISINSIISQSNIHLPLLKAYITTILNLSRKAEGSKKLKDYPPQEFFDSIKNENEFNDLAGDSYDVIRHFFQKMHEQLLMAYPENNSIFDKYIVQNNQNMYNHLNNNDIQNLNKFIFSYSSSNKSIIANLFYFIERSEVKCSNCQFSSSNFNVQLNAFFPLEDIRQWKYKKMIMMMNSNNNMNIMNNNMNNNMMNNFNNMNNNININMNFNQNNAINMDNNLNQNMNIINNMNNNMNGNNMNNGNYGCRNNLGSMMGNQINNNNMQSNPMGNNMNINSMNMNNININSMNNININADINNNNVNMNMNMNMIGNINNINPMMNNNMMMPSNMFMNINIPSIQPPTSVDLKEAFEHYKLDNPLLGQNLLCQNCKALCNHLHSNHLFTLPEILVCNLSRGQGNKYKVDITFPETIDLNNEVETKLDNHNYKLICIITHIGPHGTGGHYVAFCFLEDKGLWYKFDDSIVTESNFNEAAKLKDTYILFYKRM